jgi:hypothetical protein
MNATFVPVRKSQMPPATSFLPETPVPNALNELRAEAESAVAERQARTNREEQECRRAAEEAEREFTASGGAGAVHS